MKVTECFKTRTFFGSIWLSQISSCIRFLLHPGVNWFCKRCEYDNTRSLIQIKVYHKILHENFHDTLIRFSYRKKWILFKWNERCFHLRFFDVFPWKEVTYKKVIRHPESLISELKWECLCGCKNPQKSGPFKGIWWIGQVKF